MSENRRCAALFIPKIIYASFYSFISFLFRLQLKPFILSSKVSNTTQQISSESEKLLQGTIDALTGHIAILNRDGVIIKVNRAWREFADKNLLVDKNYGVGSNYVEACRPAGTSPTECDPHGISAAQGIMDVTHGKTPLFEYEYPCHSETEQRWFTMRVTRFGEGENLYAVVAHENITLRRIAENALRESEGSYRVLAETASDMIVRIDEESRIIFINEASQRVLGYRPEELIGQSLTVIMPEQMSQAHLRGMNRYLETGKRHIPWESMELPALHKDGRVISLEISFGEVVRDEKHYFIGIARDVTERRKSEEQLRESERRFRSMADNAPVLIWLSDTQMLCTYFNKPWLEFTGRTVEEELGFGWTDNVHPDDLEKCVETYKHSFEARKTFRMEYRLRRHDGVYRWVLDTGIPRFSPSGEFLGYIGSCFDITERKEAEDTLLRYKLLSERARDIVLLIRSDFSIAEANQAAVEQYGYTQKELLALRLHDLRAPETLGALPAQMKKADDGGVLYETMHRRRDGSEFPVEVSSIGKPIGGEFFRLHIIRDITDRINAQNALIRAERKAAKEYMTLLERIVPLAQTLGTSGDLITIYRAMHDFVCSSMDCNGFFVGLYESEKSQRAAAYGWAEGEELDVSELPPMPVNGENAGPNAEAILTGEAVVVNNYYELMKNRTHILVGDDSQPKPQSAIIVPMKVMNRVIGTIEVQSHENQAFTHEHIVAMEMAANLAAVSIENVRLLNIEAKARLEAEAANRAKDEFLSVLSHELRTPLNSMFGWVRMFRSGMLDENSKLKAIEVIDRNIRMQNNLIEDLLDVSRIISGKMRIETEEIDIVSVVRSAVENARPLADGKNISLEFNSELESQKIIGDATRLQQIVNNLINNAVKFTPEDGRISLNLTTPDHSVRIQVSDTGIGIKPEFLPVIFDRFQQVDSTTRRSHSGLGLGLTIVKHLTELHGGSVGVSSDGEGKGSTFTVEIPKFLKSEEDLPDEAKTPAEENQTDLKGARILLVDDDVDGLQPLQILLKTQKADVECAYSSAEALEILGRRRFDLLISDIGMPEMDGFELLNKVREITESENYFLPAVALTAYASMQDRERALEAGFQHHLAKPIDFDHFILTVKNLIKKFDA